VPPVRKGGEIVTGILPACLVGIFSPTSCSEEASWGGGRGRKRPFLWVSSLCMACQGVFPPAPGAPPHPPRPHPHALRQGLRRGVEPERRQPLPQGNAEQISSRWDRGHAPLLAGWLALHRLLLLLLAPAPSISVLPARTGSVSRKAAGNPPCSAPLPKPSGLAAMPVGL